MAGEDKIYSVYLKLRGKLARSVAGIVPPRDVEDIVQETYVRICQIRNVDEIESPKSFLYRTVRNLALDHRKRAENRLADMVEDIDSLFTDDSHVAWDHTFEQAASNEAFGLFCEAVRLLPMQCRRVFVLKKVYGYSQSEIAKEMNISENTVENHIATGIKKCTRFMQQHDETFGQRKKTAAATRLSRPSRSGEQSHD